MSVIDILSRVETICRKYDKYDIEKQRELNAFGDDVFARHYAHVEDEIQDLHLKAEKSAMESNRAVAVATNVEIRRSKARLMEELPKLRKLAQKKDQGLDIISEGLGTLKELAQDMNEEMDRQVPLIDEIDTKVDKVTSDIKNNNVRLKENLYKVAISLSY
ncbi:hypothetical protein ACLB2K_026764 [Fragaria x ananassa]